MGANMQRQAVPLIQSDAPLVGTGMEFSRGRRRRCYDHGRAGGCGHCGVRGRRRGDERRRDAPGLPDAEVPPVEPGHLHQPASAGRGGAASGGRHADRRRTLHRRGRRHWAGTCWWRSCCGQGHNYEDAIILSQRLVQHDVLTSIHIEEHEVDARDTKLGPEEITLYIPNVSDEMLADLDERGIIRIVSVRRSRPVTSWSARSRPRARRS